jgi:uncharacterized protein (DUF885 family)
MQRRVVCGWLVSLSVGMGSAVGQNARPIGSTPARPVVPAWIAVSDRYTQMLLDIEMKHAPESASAQGLAQYDTLITDPTRADEVLQRTELLAVLEKLKAAEATEKDKNVVEDLQIVRTAFDRQFRLDDYQIEHKVQFLNASQVVFAGLHTLLQDQVPQSRRMAALVRLRKYAGLEPGFKPFAEQLEERMKEQMAKPGAVYPSVGEMETELGRNKNYVDGIATLLRTYKIDGWEEPYGKLREELAAYDTWVRGEVMPKGRKDFRMQPEEYALALESYGVDIAPTDLEAQAHAAFAECQTEMAAQAAKVAKAHGWTSTDYRDAIRELKAKQITGDAIEPFYKARLKAIEAVVLAHQLVTLPIRPAIIRLATEAETAQQPAPHMVPPPLLHNTGQRGEFVLPLNIPSASGGAAEKYDDFTFDAAAWTLTAHEARPGHELQFDSMVEHGVSLARALYAFNSTNVEGWGLYSEWLMQPYEPAEGQLITLQFRLLRAARAYLDIELQMGKVTPEEAYKVLENDVVLSHAFAKEEVERFTYRSPGQANSYFYGYTKLMELRKDTQAALGPKFNQKRFHDFLLRQGLLPPDLLRKAVFEDFVPAQK